MEVEEKWRFGLVYPKYGLAAGDGGRNRGIPVYLRCTCAECHLYGLAAWRRRPDAALSWLVFLSGQQLDLSHWSDGPDVLAVFS